MAVRQFQQVIALGPTLAADHTFNFIAPFNCTLIHISLCNSTANAGTFDCGIAADPDGWMDGKAFGVSGTPLEYDEISDFDGAVSDSQFPSLTKGSNYEVVVKDHASHMANAYVVLTFVEG